MTYPDVDIPATIWGDRSHFNLAAPFEAAERCRQIVFWSVDWTSYVDFETCPSAPVDASKYAKAAPLAGPVDGCGYFTGLMEGFPWLDMHIYSYRNAESVFSFMEDVSGRATGSDIDAVRVLNNGRWGSTPDWGSSSTQKMVFNGLHGADRNFNGLLDRGPLPVSMRMRAFNVGRFNYYDLRVPCVVR
jgi:hypothetical protein